MRFSVSGFSSLLKTHQRVAPGRDRRLGRRDDARVERVGEIGDGERDQLAAPALQVARHQRRRVAQIAHGGQHAGAQFAG